MKTLLILLTFFLSLNAFAQKGLIIIVNANNPVQKLTTFQISEMFLKKSRNWQDGNPIRFFDRNDDTPERKAFLTYIMKRTARDLDQYWIGQKLYTGNSAPVQLASDSMTISLVSRFPGAISYISPDSFIENKGIKKIEIEANP